MILPSDMSSEANERNVDCSADLSTNLSDGNGALLSDPLIFSAFTRYWDKELSTLEVAENGSYSWDLCTKLPNYIAALHYNDERWFSITTPLQVYIDKSWKEHEHYRARIYECRGIAEGGRQLFVYELAEKFCFYSSPNNLVSSTF